MFRPYECLPDNRFITVHYSLFTILNTFYQEVASFIQICYDGAIEINCVPPSHPILILKDKKIIFLLLKLPTTSVDLNLQAEVKSFADQCEQEGIQLISIWEDRWSNCHQQVMARIGNMFGRFKRIHARQTEVIKITQPDLDVFMNRNHLYGSAQAKYKYGLLYQKELVAAASFSGLRNYYRSQSVYRSSELIRFANKNGYCVVGGMGKLLKHFIRSKQPDDIMTYADCDWSSGHSFVQLGFTVVEKTPFQTFWIHPSGKIRYATHRLPNELIHDFQQQHRYGLEEFIKRQGYTQVFDRGNIKYLKIIKIQ